MHLSSPSRIQPMNIAVMPDKNVGMTATRHFPEYAMEAAGLGLFMVSACAFTTAIFHPASPLTQVIPSVAIRRVLMSLAMGGTALTLTCSRWGKRSGAHFNPAVTLTFFRLGKVRPVDAFSYVVSQFVGAVAGVAAAGVLLRPAIAHQSVRYAATAPGRWGEASAFFAELAITFVLMTVILFTTNSQRLMRWTPVLAACLIATYIALESPISGMSMNPARSAASALGARYFHGLWIYFTAPLLGMLTAAELFLRLRGVVPVCAKLHHANNERCIFRCGYLQPAAEANKAAA